MKQLARTSIGLVLAGLLCGGVAYAGARPRQAGQDPSQQQPPAAQSGSQSPGQTQPTQQPAPPQPAPPQPTAATKTGDVSQDTPVQQKDAVTPKNSKQDVEKIGDRNVGKGLNFYSIEKEMALGKALAQEVEKSSKLIDDPVVTEYVNRVGQNLVHNSDAKVPFTIKVIDSDEINAFALPGGFFYVNSGLILAAHEESELAGVMAHEIAHVAARHGTKNATKGDIMQLASIPAMIFIPYGWAGYGIYEGMNLAIPLTFLKFSRDAEREADYLGLQYMYKAGYDPNSYVTFFERIQADEKRRPGSIPKVFSTHPPTPDRIENTQKEIAQILPSRPEYIVSTSEFDSVKARLRNIMFAKKATDSGPGKPTLRTKTEQSKQPQPGADPSSTSGDDDRPTLKRRPDSGQP
ncbi:MAG TPA: M48 family metallopeptidase [Candidatus Acidoferrum sp.]|nr:M48 family metallopeptidase [Candidatus Acidoferrum sp.]